MNNPYFQTDYFRMTGKRARLSFQFVLDLLLRHNIRFMYWIRSNARKKSILKKFILYQYAKKYGLEFSQTAKIGKGLYLGHPYNITIGDGCTLGDNVNLHKGVTIGVENRGKRIGAPTIGNRVFVGINATVVGNISVGDDVLIAPGAYVNFDVPSHSIVIGNPGMIRPCEKATEGYIRNCVD